MKQEKNVMPYSPDWPKQFESIEKQIRPALKESFVAIHHVGSTSVPDLAAKPIIDIIAEVKHLSFDHAPLLKLNFAYRGGFGLPFRKSFTYRSNDLNVNLHVFEHDDPEVELNLMLRDHLRKDTADREAYEQLKYRLASDEECDKKNGSLYRKYTLDKHPFLEDILKKLGFDRQRLVLCAHYADWNGARYAP